MRIDIFIDTDAKGTYRYDRGLTWYMMESVYKEKPLIKRNHVAWLDHNRNGAVLEGLLFALRQIRAAGAEINIYTENKYICGYFPKLEEWRHSGYKNRKGEQIKYGYMWQQIGDIVARKNVRICLSNKIPEDKKEDLRQFGESLKHR